LHYINEYIICTECLIEHPDLIEIMEAMQESETSAEEPDADAMHSVLIEVPFDEVISRSEESSDQELPDYI
jgi:hypothetical protein